MLQETMPSRYAAHSSERMGRNVDWHLGTGNVLITDIACGLP